MSVTVVVVTVVCVWWGGVGQDVGSASPWAEVVLLEQAQRKFRHLLAAFTEVGRQAGRPRADRPHADVLMGQAGR